MDKLIERLDEIDEQIIQHRQSIFLLREEAETIQDELFELREKQQRSEDIAWRQMKL